MPFAVMVAEIAIPEEFVTAVLFPPANVPLAPDGGAVNVTVTPGTRFPPTSVTVADNGLPNAVLIFAPCPEPPLALMVAGAPTRFVKTNTALAVTPGTEATTLYGPPAMLFAVNVAEVAIPDASVTAVFFPPAKVPLGPDTGGANVTVTPGTGLPLVSVTSTESGVVKAVLIFVLFGVPPFATIFAGVLVVLVNEKLVDSDPTEAITWYEPVIEFAVNTADVARPLASVIAVLRPPAKVPLGPEEGAVNVTVTPLTGLPCTSVTFAISGLLNAVVVWALCGVPPAATIEAGARFKMVSVKLTLADCAGEAESVTLKVRGVFVTGAVGVPLIRPPGERCSPFGSVPDVRAQT